MNVGNLKHKIGAALGTLGVLVPVIDAINTAPPELRAHLPNSIKVVSVLAGIVALIFTDRHKLGRVQLPPSTPADYKAPPPPDPPSR